jgi:uncharacterized SAM-binding protein YcdF (DUF218 family)
VSNIAAGGAVARRTTRTVAAILLVLVVGWGGGFAWFVGRVMRPAPEPPHADGIVVLTGGADRIATALRLLRDGRARVLLVSGVSPAAGFGRIARFAGVDPAPLAARVTLGRSATSTLGNAEETAAWVRANKLHSLLVVTAAYHMPRALTEIGRAVPEVTLYPVTVMSPAMREGHSLGTLRLLAHEYTKWLGARLGLSYLAHA